MTYICAGYVHRNGTFWEVQDVHGATLKPAPLSTICIQAPTGTEWVILWDYKEQLYAAFKHQRLTRATGSPARNYTSPTLTGPLHRAETVEAAIMLAVLKS